MRIPLFPLLALVLGLTAGVGRAASPANPEIVALGHDTYALTRWAETGFTRNTEKLKAQALEDAAAYCARLHKELKVVSTTGERPAVPLTGFAHAKVVFKALDANDPELLAPAAAPVPMIPGTVTVPPPPPKPVTPTDALYNDLMKLDDLRKRGILTEEEFQAQKKKLLEKTN